MADTDTPEDKARNPVVGSEPSTPQAAKEVAEQKRPRQPQSRSRTVDKVTADQAVPARRPPRRRQLRFLQGQDLVLANR